MHKIVFILILLCAQTRCINVESKLTDLCGENGICTKLKPTCGVQIDGYGDPTCIKFNNSLRVNLRQKRKSALRLIEFINTTVSREWRKHMTNMKNYEYSFKRHILSSQSKIIIMSSIIIKHMNPYVQNCIIYICTVTLVHIL